MKQVLTVACKIEVPKEVAPKINATLEAFASACNYINQTVPPYMTNNVRIQTLTYQDVRNQFGLSANLAVRAINRVAGNRKTAQKAGKPVKEFKPTSADYDSRIFSFREQDWTVSLNLIGGRERFKLLIGNYQLGLLKGHCGWKGDADHNGSMNIASLGVVYVNRPRGPGLVCSLDRDDSGLLKARAIPVRVSAG